MKRERVAKMCVCVCVCMFKIIFNYQTTLPRNAKHIEKERIENKIPPP